MDRVQLKFTGEIKHNLQEQKARKVAGNVRKEIKKLFEDLEVQWDQVKYFFSKFYQRIHNVYLPFTSQEEAKKAYDKREEIIKEFQD